MFLFFYLIYLLLYFVFLLLINVFVTIFIYLYYYVDIFVSLYIFVAVLDHYLSSLILDFDRIEKKNVFKAENENVFVLTFIVQCPGIRFHEETKFKLID